MLFPRAHQLEGTLLVPDETIPSSGSLVHEPEEIYLELSRVDLDDENAILGFVGRYRTLGVRADGFAAFRDFPGFEESVRPGLEAAWKPQDEAPGLLRVESLEDFRFGGRCIRDLVRAWRIQDGEELTPQWESLPQGASWLRADERAVFELHEAVPSPADEAVAVLMRLMTSALRPFQPQVLPVPFEQIEDASLGMVVVPLYSICCLELYNHMVERAVYKRCANERCGAIFVRQRGRAAFGQHRTEGVKYCSAECARAQVQREYRARLRQERDPRGPGPSVSRRGSSRGRKGR
jgi:hypothetical protein